MLNSNPLIFILLDAFRWDYINKEDCPFLFSLAENGISGSAIPTFGFEPDAAYLAGMSPEECDGGAMFWKHNSNKDFNFTKFFPSIIDNSPDRINLFIRKLVRVFAQINGRTNRIKKYCDPCFIPYDSLHKFSFSNMMSYYPWENGFLKNNTIFHELERNKIKYYYHCIPDNKVKSEIVLNRFIKSYNNQFQYSFLFIGDLDSLGHIYGPNSDERKIHLKKIDAKIEKIYNHAKNINNDLNFILLGDHGMVDVKSKIDITEIIQLLKKNNIEYDYFIDSTMFRIWSNNDSSINFIKNKLKKVNGLTYVDDKMKSKYSINYNNNYYWDECWIVEEGFVLQPNFYGKGKPPLGMHGYLPETKDNKPAFIIHSSDNLFDDTGKYYENIDMRKFYHIQRSLLNLTSKNVIECLIK